MDEVLEDLVHQLSHFWLSTPSAFLMHVAKCIHQGLSSLLVVTVSLHILGNSLNIFVQMHRGTTICSLSILEGANLLYKDGELSLDVVL